MRFSVALAVERDFSFETSKRPSKRESDVLITLFRIRGPKLTVDHHAWITESHRIVENG